MLKSKKFLMTLLNLAAMIAVKLGAPETTVAEMSVLIAPLVAYVLAQGQADRGKHAAETEAWATITGRGKTSDN